VQARRVGTTVAGSIHPKMADSASSQVGRKEVSESAFEFLLAELFAMAQQQVQTSTSPSQPTQQTAQGSSSTGDDATVDPSNTVAARLDSMGFHVGYRFTEKILASQKLLGTEYLDVIKFICKEFWEEVFKKKVALDL
jgi:hypothetical protein